MTLLEMHTVLREMISESQAMDVSISLNTAASAGITVRFLWPDKGVYYYHITQIEIQTPAVVPNNFQWIAGRAKREWVKAKKKES